MAIHRRQGSNVIDYVKYENASGIRMDPGPHIGIVKHVVDTTRSGRLIVFLPHLGGDPENIDNCRIVSYASPFFGTTNLQVNGANSPRTANDFESVRHSYGMWFNPPDVGIKVLVIFETGDPNNGYWFACIPGIGEHHTVASMGGTTRGQITRDGEVDALIAAYGANYVPALDYNSADNTAVNRPGMHTNKRPPHKIQTNILSNQGLLGDEDRGINDSSTVRESPSGVFGITTPGRVYKDQMTDALLQRVSTSKPSTPPPAVEKVDTGRKGGHSFIMDDGDVYGESRLVRLRTAAGHQIMMNDTDGFVYISNSTGSNWIELTNDGNMFIYAQNDISFRCGRDMSFKVDRDLKFEVDRDLHIKVKNHMQVENKTQDDFTEEDRQCVIGNDFNLKVKQKMKIVVDQDVDLTIDGKFTAQVKGTTMLKTQSLSVTATGDISMGADGQNIINGDTVQINSVSSNPTQTPQIFDIPDELEKIDLNDSEELKYTNTSVWKHRKPSEHTEQTTLSIIPTHEPYKSRDGNVTPLVSKTGRAASGPPRV